MSWDRKLDWRVVGEGADAKVQCYSLYDIQEYYMALERGEEYSELYIEAEFSFDEITDENMMVKLLNHYKSLLLDSINRK